MEIIDKIFLLHACLFLQEMVASVQVPASLFAQLPRQPGSRPASQLIVSMFANARLFPETNSSETWGVTSCVVGCKLSKYLVE